MSPRPVCAVVVNWNGWRDTIPCIESLLQQRGVSLHVVVCDNASGDDSIARIEAWRAGRPDVALLALPANLGYAGGLNAGIRWAREHWDAQAFWLLNNDLIAEPDALQAMVLAHAAVPRAGICGSVLMDWDRPAQVQAVAGVFSRWRGLGWHSTELPAAEWVDVDYPVGASLYVEREFLDAVGLMDDSYFLYCEEMDWAERARRRGWRVIVATASRLRHKEGASTGSRGGVRNKSLLSERYGVVNRLRLTRRFWPAWLPVVWLSLLLVTADRLAHAEWRRAALVLRLMVTPLAWWR